MISFLLSDVICANPILWIQRIKDVVHQTTKLNEAFSAVGGRGVPLTRAHITSGGYYTAL